MTMKHARSNSAPNEDDESCSVCMSRPLTVRNRPCAHAMCCELCTIQSMKPAERSLRCQNCRSDVSWLEMLSANAGGNGNGLPRVTQMITYQQEPQAGAQKYNSLHAFLQAMLESKTPQVAEAAAGMIERWGVAEERAIILSEDDEEAEADPAYPIVDGHAIVPEGVTAIGYQAFIECSSLTSVDIPSSVTTIGFGAFGGCSFLTSVDIPSSVKTISDSAFHSCSSLTSVTIPSSVTKIGDYAFAFCSSLTLVDIPSSVTTIGDSAFAFCDSLASVAIPATVELGSYAFDSWTDIQRLPWRGFI